MQRALVLRSSTSLSAISQPPFAPIICHFTPRSSLALNSTRKLCCWTDTIAQSRTRLFSQARSFTSTSRHHAGEKQKRRTSQLKALSGRANATTGRDRTSIVNSDRQIAASNNPSLQTSTAEDRRRLQKTKAPISRPSRVEGSKNRNATTKQRTKSNAPSLDPKAAAQELNDIIKQSKLPSISEIPNAPTDLYKSPSSALHTHVAALSNFREHASISRDGYKHSISVDDPSVGQIQVAGAALSKINAKHAAYLYFLAELHAKRLAATFFPISVATVRKEKHAMIDVYLFAARYQDIPQIVHRTANRKRRAGLQEVDVNLPLLGIHVTGKGLGIERAEIAAALFAKRAIEEYVATESAADRKVPDEQVFGFASAAAFSQWYKYQNRGVDFELRTRNGNGGRITCQVLMNETKTETSREFATATATSKKVAEDLAQFIAAVTLTGEDSSLRTSFFEEYLRNNSQILPPITPITFEMRRETEEAIHRAIVSSRHATEELGEDLDTLIEERIRKTIYKPLTPLSFEKKCGELKSRQDAYELRDDLEKLRKTRAEYPMNQYAEQVLDIVQNNVYSIIIGATGSGKTTQVPQILLNEAVRQGSGASCNIICTQPRRIAAKSVSQRVADERAEFIGDCVGYHVKKDAKLPCYGGSINFCTTGILSAQLQHQADDIMDNASHLIIDEVHERDTMIDFLLANLKRLVNQRLKEGKRVPRIVLMSATIDPEMFSSYLTTQNAVGESVDCPHLSVPGRTFPVKEVYMEEVVNRIKATDARAVSDSDTVKYISVERSFAASNQSTPENNIEEGENQSINWEAERKRATTKGRVTVEEKEEALVPHQLAAATIAHIASTTDEGAILTFLPGLEDITKIDQILRLNSPAGVDFNDPQKYKIFMLHSTIQNTQREVFEPLPIGCRKIILATNIAETSITIPDVQHVVDTGKLRELQYDQLQRITKLSCVWASKSNVQQRAGRAGRVQNGNYYALYSKERYNALRAVGLPELLRSDLQEVCLNIKSQGYAVPIKEFLMGAIEPPSMAATDAAINNLVGLQALNEDESMTALGKLLAQLPVHPSLGKMIVLGIVFRCLDPMLIIGSSFSEKSIFVQPLERRQEAREKKQGFARNTLSDHIGLLAAVKELRMLYEVRGPRAMGDYAMRNFLHMGAFRNILGTAESIETLLVDHGVIPRTSKLDRAHFQFGDPQLNENSDKVGLIKALILAGFYPNLGVRRGRFTYRTTKEVHTIVYPSSINATDLKARRGRSEGPSPPPDHKTELLSFSELARSADGNTMYIRDTTPVTPLMSVLFSGTLEHGQARNIIKMDHWLPFYLRNGHQVPLVFKLHRVLQKVTTAAFNDLAARRSLTDHEDRNRFADALVEVLDADLASSAAKSEGYLGKRKLDPASAFGSRRTTDGDKPAFSYRKQDPKRQEQWDNLIASWVDKRPNNSAQAGSTSPPRESVASLFAQGHADLKPASDRAARSSRPY